MQQTYPETTTFRWEGDTPTLVSEAVEFLDVMSKQGGSKARRESLKATAQALRDISAAKDKPHFTGDQIKTLLVAAAQEHGWLARKGRSLPDLRAPEGMKVCFKCKQVKELDQFKTAPTPAKALSYGWRSDTDQKVIGPLCTTCRKTKADEQGRKRQRRVSRQRIDKLSAPASAVLKQYQKLKLQIAAHMNRVRAAFHNAKSVLPDPAGDGQDLIEYQFRNTDAKAFYEMKRALLLDARDRLEQRLSEAAPLPGTWGMLLTQAEQNNLASLHMYACIGVSEANAPALWKVAPRKQDEE